MSRLVLASASPRRAELLALLGRPFEVIAADVDETIRPGERPDDAVERLAVAKARAVAPPQAFTIGADTVVVLDDRILGKPDDDHDAAEMLRALAGRTHTVVTGVAIVGPAADQGPCRTLGSFVTRTEVTFIPLTDPQIERYVASGEPRDKAGAYGIQGVAGAFVAEIRGSFHNVVGLPVAQLSRRLDELTGDATRATS